MHAHSCIQTHQDDYDQLLSDLDGIEASPLRPWNRGDNGSAKSSNSIPENIQVTSTTTRPSESGAGTLYLGADSPSLTPEQPRKKISKTHATSFDDGIGDELLRAHMWCACV